MNLWLNSSSSSILFQSLLSFFNSIFSLYQSLSLSLSPLYINLTFCLSWLYLSFCLSHYPSMLCLYRGPNAHTIPTFTSHPLPNWIIFLLCSPFFSQYTIITSFPTLKFTQSECLLELGSCCTTDVAMFYIQDCLTLATPTGRPSSSSLIDLGNLVVKKWSWETRLSRDLIAV